jgi:hypothetical protein
MVHKGALLTVIRLLYCLLAFFVLIASVPAEPVAEEPSAETAIPNLLVMSPKLAQKGMANMLEAVESEGEWVLTTTSLLDNVLLVSVADDGSFSIITAAAAEFLTERVKFYRGAKHDFAADWSLKSSISFSEYSHEGSAAQGAWNVVELEPGKMFLFGSEEGASGSYMLLEANPGGFPPLSLAREVSSSEGVTTLGSGLKIEFSTEGGLKNRLSFDELTVGGGGMTTTTVKKVQQKESFQGWDPFLIRGPVMTGDRTMPDLPPTGAYFVPPMKRIGVIDFFEPEDCLLPEAGKNAALDMVRHLKGIEGLEIVRLPLTEEQRDKPLLFSAAVDLASEYDVDGLLLGEITKLESTAKRYTIGMAEPKALVELDVRLVEAVRGNFYWDHSLNKEKFYETYEVDKPEVVLDTLLDQACQEVADKFREDSPWEGGQTE